jgi:hypothetical protein
MGSEGRDPHAPRRRGALRTAAIVAGAFTPPMLVVAGAVGPVWLALTAGVLVACIAIAWRVGGVLDTRRDRSDDWAAFERDFRRYAAEHEVRRGRIPPR